MPRARTGNIQVASTYLWSYLQSPGCVDKIWVFPALVLDEALTDTHVGKQVQGRDEHIHETHKTKYFRH